MAVKALGVKSYNMCVRKKWLRCVAFERDFRSTLVGNMRCTTSLFPKASYSFYRSKHKVAEKLLQNVHGFEKASVSKRSKLLSGVPVFVNYGGLDDIIDNERANEHFNNHNSRDHDFDISLACKRFASISLQDSPPVKLYDGTSCNSVDSALLAAKICQEVLPCYIDDKLVDSDCIYEACTSLYQEHVTEASSSVKENVTPICSDSPTWKIEQRQDLDSNISQTPSKTTGLEIEDTSVSLQPILDQSISCIPGLTKRQCNQLENCGFHTLRKLLCHYPRTYADLQNAQVGIEDGQYFIFVGKISSSRGVRATYSLSYLEVVVACEIAQTSSKSECVVDEIEHGRTTTLYLHLKKFFRGTRFTCLPFLRSLEEKHKKGDIVCVSGKVRKMRANDHYEMREYTLDILQDEENSSFCQKERLYPIYPSKAGLKPNFLRDVILRGLQAVPANVDPIPKVIREDLGLVSLHDAYMGIHQPKDLLEADLARKRLIFDEFFYLQLGRLYQMLESLGTKLEKDGLLDKYRKPELNEVLVKEWSSLTKEFLETLPYSLTPSQLSAVSEIIWDLKRPVPMNRLLQGDVGCGKTVVAFLACMEVVGSGFQAAFMVPTELLALQHYEHLLNLVEKMEDDCKPSIALLTGSTPSRQSKIIREGLKTGDISLVIGTHSLISEKIEFSSLRIAVIDEQHRFGVIQRGRFNSKLYYNSSSSISMVTITDDSTNNDMIMAPHVLAMSATPIPRSLALALYGDMSLTQITDLPPGRIPVKTCIIEGNEAGFEEVYQMMMDELEGGGKVYVVYPVIEQSEQLPQLRAASAELETISKRFPGYSCGLLHGKLKADAKEEALGKFRSGETNILLSTQVIEIGVDVPDASMMVVMNAERFGMAQLHQLRGRVGRGERESRCILVASTAGSLNRLKVLEKSSDGFHLANMDLLLRGPGDLLGKKQSGHLPEFPIARLEIDGNIIQEAHLAAMKILGESHDLEKFPNLKGELSMRQPLCPLGD